MLVLGFLFAVQAATAPPVPAVRSRGQARVQILQGTRIEDGRSTEAHSRGRAEVTDAGGSRRVIRLIEFH